MAHCLHAGQFLEELLGNGVRAMEQVDSVYNSSVTCGMKIFPLSIYLQWK